MEILPSYLSLRLQRMGRSEGLFGMQHAGYHEAVLK